MGWPRPAARRTPSSMPRPVQQSATAPSMATAGTELIPSSFAYSVTLSSFMSRTITSHESHAHSLILATASSHTEQPALKLTLFGFRSFQFSIVINRFFSTVPLAMNLNRWTRHRSIGTIDAAVPVLRLDDGSTALTIVKILTRIRRHGFGFLMPTFGACNHRSEFNRRLFTIGTHGCSSPSRLSRLRR